MAHEAHRRLGGTCTPGVGCIPVSILADAEDSKARGNNCPQTDRLWDVVSRLSETVGRHDAALATKLTHPKLAVIQANLVTIDAKLVRMAMCMQQGDPLQLSVASARTDVQDALRLIAEYRSA